MTVYMLERRVVPKNALPGECGVKVMIGSYATLDAAKAAARVDETLMDEKTKETFVDLLDSNAVTCAGIAMQIGTYEGRVGIETTGTIYAILAVAEAVRLLARIQLSMAT